MSNVNSSQVQSTNDASTTSKYSAANKKYFNDPFIEHFVCKKKTRVSLINLGYFTRALILYEIIKNFINFLKQKNCLKVNNGPYNFCENILSFVDSLVFIKIISCGCGFDTTFWRLSEANLLSQDSLFIEIDFPEVVRRKISLINQSNVLKSYINLVTNHPWCKGINQMSDNYFLLEGDLHNVGELEKLFDNININRDIPTLFLSECVITYMNVKSSNFLIQWIAKNFKNGAFINYEQIHPNDGFGIVMIRHFEKIQSSLFSVKDYPDCTSHHLRYKQFGFENSLAISEWDAFVSLTSVNDRINALLLEVFDEFEEFHNKCAHYVVGIAGNQLASEWINCNLPFGKFKEIIDFRNSIQLRCVTENLELFRHSSFTINNEKIYLIGGCKKQKRSSEIFCIDFKNNFFTEVAKVSKKPQTQLDIVFGSVTYFRLNDKNFLCMYGGRSSPEKVCNGGALVIFEFVNNQFILKSEINLKNRIPHYRSSIATFDLVPNKVQCWIFGGRSVNILNSSSDLFRLDITMESNDLTSKSTVYKKSDENWPCSRMSHSMTACNKNLCLYVSCGLKTDSLDVLNDVWKWCSINQKWQKFDLSGPLLPRYGHTTHLVSNFLYLVGGVNTKAGFQPGIAKINLSKIHCTEYILEPPGPQPVLLFNHSSEVVKDNENIYILIIGGGGNCFSFGTHLNQGIYSIQLT